MKLAALRIRGLEGVRRDIDHTLFQLRLHRKNYCVVVNDSQSMRGMLEKVKDFTTWGEIDDAVYAKLVEKRGEEYTGRVESANKKIQYKKFIIVDHKKYKPYFRLNNPLCGFERGGIKKAFSVGGVLGYRGHAINDLLSRMI